MYLYITFAITSVRCVILYNLSLLWREANALQLQGILDIDRLSEANVFLLGSALRNVDVQDVILKVMIRLSKRSGLIKNCSYNSKLIS